MSCSQSPSTREPHPCEKNSPQSLANEAAGSPASTTSGPGPSQRKATSKPVSTKAPPSNEEPSSSPPSAPNPPSPESSSPKPGRKRSPSSAKPGSSSGRRTSNPKI